MTKYHAPLHDYQEVAVKSVEGGNPALFLEMGLGKTLSTLEILHRSQYRMVLLIAPLMICEEVWGEEIKKWEYPINYIRLQGSPRKRMCLIEFGKPGIYSMTPELTVWLCNNDLYKHFDYVVIDELTKFKSSKSKRWRALSKQIRKHPHIERLGLTGTPSPKGLIDLWAMMYMLDSGRTLGIHKGKYTQAFFKDLSPDPRKYHKYVPLPGAERRILGRMKEMGVISMLAKDVLGQKPPVELPHITIPMPTVAAKIYRELEVDLMATMPDGTIVLPEYDTTISIKMRQLASGFMLDDDGVAHTVHWEKVKALKEYLELAAGQPQLIVFTYKHEAAMIQKMLGNMPLLAGGVGKATRKAHIQAWNKGHIPAMLVQPQAAGHGVNLQFGGHHVLYYSSDWNLENYQQVLARIHRQGQTSTVFTRHMVGGPTEGRIIDALRRKAAGQHRLMKHLSVEV